MSRKYYLPNDPRNPLRVIADRLTRKPLADTPETVLIETMAGCNARCVFCPIGDDEIRRAMPMGRMSHDLFRKILDDLAEAPPRQIIPCFANEPFLDGRLIDWLLEIRERLPSSEVTVITNGSLLTEAVAKRLLDEQVPDVLNISFQGVEKSAYEATMGPLDFDETLARVLGLIEMKAKRNLERPDIRVSMVETSLVEGRIGEARRFWESHGVKLDVDAMENRGGSVALDGLAEQTVPFVDCRRPFNTLVIAFDGQVPLCCVDFERHVVVGDMNQQTVREIWSSEPLMEIRRGFLDPTQREKLPVTCRNCELAQ